MLHAPNVHTGGGLVLLQALLDVPTIRQSAWLQLDRRTSGRLNVSAGGDVHYVGRSVLSRLGAEWRLWRACRAGSVVLCFHGIPPWFPVRGRVVVFLQNSLLLGRDRLKGFPFAVAWRIRLERLLCRLLRRRVDEYVVQTASMARELNRWHGADPKVRVLTFGVPEPVTELCGRHIHEYDFVYVASGLAHKNHLRLLDAWALLAKDGLFPSLALTVEHSSERILRRLDALRSAHGIRVDNLASMDRECVFALYRSSRALIFPSLGESLGLPLLEAAECNLPILAAERDYVRDVVIPKETFDPESAVSIARAVRRFLGAVQPPVPLATPDRFVAQVLQT